MEKELHYVVYEEGSLDPAYEVASFASLEEAEAYRASRVAELRERGVLDSNGVGVLPRPEFEVYEAEEVEAWY